MKKSLKTWIDGVSQQTSSCVSPKGSPDVLIMMMMITRNVVLIMILMMITTPTGPLGILMITQTVGLVE